MNSDKKLSKRLEPLIEKSTIHGFSNIFLSKRPFNKLFWLIFLKIFVAFTIFFVIRTLKAYYKFEVNTELKIREKKQIEFPTVTICNLECCGFLNYDFDAYLKKHKQDEETRLGYNMDREIENNFKYLNIKTNWFTAKEIFLRKYDPSKLEKVLSDTTDSFKKSLVSCAFDQEKCSFEDFNFFQMAEFSKCYKFNSGRDIHEKNISLRKLSRFGKQNGLRIELNLGKNHQCKSPVSRTSGLAVYIHDQNYNLNEEDDAILIRPNTQTDIALDLTTVMKLPYPYSDCYKDLKSVKIEDTNLIVETIKLTKSYTQQYCLKLCFQKFLIKNCNCHENSLLKFSPRNVSKCAKFIDSLYTCQYIITKLFYNGKNDQQCIKKCPKDCELKKYESTVSSSSIKYEKKTNEDNMVWVDVYLNTGSITEITEKPAMQDLDLFTNIGGYMGLFLGISLLSLIEIVEIFISSICHLKKNLQLKKKN